MSSVQSKHLLLTFAHSLEKVKEKSDPMNKLLSFQTERGVSQLDFILWLSVCFHDACTEIKSKQTQGCEMSNKDNVT